jgi:hypothetical protein
MGFSNQAIIKISVIFAFVSACLFSSGLALASHKAYLLKSSGSECQFGNATATDVVAGSGWLLNSSTSSNRTANCPLVLASRWGSKGTTVFDAPTWVDARSAIVYMRRFGAATQTSSCYAVMESNQGSLYYSASLQNSGGAGVFRIDLATAGNGLGTWASGAASTLEQNETAFAQSLTFVCSLGPQTAVLGTKAKICQFTQDCHESGGDPENEEGAAPSDLMNFVQTSGIECSATLTPSNVNHGYDGTSVSFAAQDVYCPISTPADDTHEHQRRLLQQELRYSGGSDAANCVTSGTCPSCRVQWLGRDGVPQNGPVLAKSSTSTRLLTSSGFLSVSREVGLGMLCTVPAGVTIEGLTTAATVSGVLAGT